VDEDGHRVAKVGDDTYVIDVGTGYEVGLRVAFTTLLARGVDVRHGFERLLRTGSAAIPARASAHCPCKRAHGRAEGAAFQLSAYNIR
jgi:hypothetical protein